MTQSSSFSLSTCKYFIEHFQKSSPEFFHDIENAIKVFETQSFQELPLFDRYKSVHRVLFDLIKNFSTPCFLFSAVLDFFDRVNQKKIFEEAINFASFELWLVHFSDISEADNKEIREKIVGKAILRADYQSFFPLGMGHTYNGTHFVTAHLSPDVDTMIASFWGWVDAFAARVGNGLHTWCLPGEPPHSPITTIFTHLFGKNLIPLTARNSKSLFLTAKDLLAQEKPNVERIDVSVKIKGLVRSISETSVTLDTEIDEIRCKLEQEDEVTVVMSDSKQENSEIPVGIIKASHLKDKTLATVSFRDFCNFEEVKMAPNFEVISVVDHHKNNLKTSTIPTILVADVQSSNTLMAEQMFQINDLYSLGSMSVKEIDAEIEEISKELTTKSQRRILQRLLQKKNASEQLSSFYIHPKREFNEYVSFLLAILDDTDLLTKVSLRDLLCIAKILNRLKSLSLGKEVEIITFDDIEQDKGFIKKAAKRILSQPDMYAFYKEIYSAKEAEVDQHLNFCFDGLPTNIFLDSKEQNGCARIGQTKLFASNFSLYHQKEQKIRQTWLELSHEIHKLNPEIDLYIHMISTIASADEVYHDQIGPYYHQDELWLWVPNEQGLKHLNHFLFGFHKKVKGLSDHFTFEFIGSETGEMQKVFSKHFVNPFIVTEKKHGFSFVVVRFKAGLMNSRKAMISPFLPHLIPQ